MSSEPIRPLILSADETAKLVNLNRVSLWRLQKTGNFPQRIRLTSRKIGFVRTEVEDWVKSRPRVGVATKKTRLASRRKAAA
jgi:prophage regulatory protein